MCAAYWRADVVFVGQLLKTTPVERKSDDSGDFKYAIVAEAWDREAQSERVSITKDNSTGLTLVVKPVQ